MLVSVSIYNLLQVIRNVEVTSVLYVTDLFHGDRNPASHSSEIQALSCNTQNTNTYQNSTTVQLTARLYQFLSYCCNEPHVKSSMIEASDLVWLTSSLNHAINGGSVFWESHPQVRLLTPAPLRGPNWNIIRPI